MHSLHQGVFIFGLALLVTSSPVPNPCSSQSVDEAKKSERVLADFAVNIYKNITNLGKPGKNEVISPVSIALALAMLENGADGETRQQLQKQLIELGAGHQVLSVYAALQKQLTIGQGQTKLQLSNGVFHDKTIQLKPDYQKSTQQCLEAQVQEVDFKNQLEEARQNINKFVSDKTSNKIPELFKRNVLTADSQVVLANAIYLNAPWQTAFNKRATKDGLFHEKGGVQHPETVPYMISEGGYRASANDKLQVLEMKYRQGDLSFYVLLPKEREGIIDFEKHLTGDQLRQLIDQVSYQKMQVHLPKFAIRSPTDLKPVLSAMGLDGLFTRQADLSRLSDQKLEISHAIHEAYIKIDEDGTEAAAATGAEAVNTAVLLGDPTKFVADHPFMYAIVHNPTRAVVFIGRVDDVHEKADE